MLDEDGELVDIFGRYSSMALEGQTGLIESLKGPNHLKAMKNGLAEQKFKLKKTPDGYKANENKQET